MPGAAIVVGTDVMAVQSVTSARAAVAPADSKSTGSAARRRIDRSISCLLSPGDASRGGVTTPPMP